MVSLPVFAKETMASVDDDDRVSFSSEPSCDGSDKQEEEAAEVDHGYYPFIAQDSVGKLFVVDETLGSKVELPSKHGAAWRLIRDPADPHRVQLICDASTTRPRWVHQLLTCSKVLPYERLGLDLLCLLWSFFNP